MLEAGEPAVTETTIETNGLRFDTIRAGDGDRLVVLLHGFPDNAGSMASLAAAAERVGYTAVAPNLRGYGTAETEIIPSDEFHVAYVVLDVLDIIETLGFEEAALVGHDTGAIAAYFAGKFAPDIVTSIVPMAVPPLFWENISDYPQQLFRSWYIAFFQLPQIPEAALRADDFALVERFWREWSPGWDYPAERLESVKETFRTPGTAEAALSYYRHMFHPISEVDDFTTDERVSPTDAIEVPTLVLGGETDGCIGPELFWDIDRAFDRTWEREIVADAGHFLHHERAAHVEALVTEFLTQS
ncbi:alpha/beta fold hydrolase [Halomarina halobia]|uniref:Alpha/beta fold hydrolase n=1 Tax=Halomarina halobia TaxID=3033386 RepID=A0ABD6AG04_9EURY|nr:alpha/beta hydrolase [Halomarina sp. PSR21]